MIKKFLSRFQESPLFLNSRTLIIGTVIAQLIPIAIQPFLRRYFSAEDFGIAAIFSALVGMGVSAANLKYENAIVLPEKEEEATHLLIGGVGISAIFSLLCWIILYSSQSLWMNKLGLNGEESWIFYFLPLSLFLVSSFQCFNYYLIRKKAFKDSARNKIYRRGSEALSQSGFAFIKSSYGLIYGTLIGDFINFTGGLYQIKRNGFRWNLPSRTLFATLKKYGQFPLFHAMPSLLNTVSLILPVIIVNTAFGKASTGQFDLSRLVLALPMALISIALSQVYLQNLAEKIQKNQAIYPDFRKVALVLLGISLPLVILLYFFSIPIFELLFGSEWTMAGEITALLVIGQTIKFIVSPLSSSLIALKEVRFSALWQILYFGAMYMLYLNPGVDIYDFIIRYCILDVFAYGIYYIIIYLVVKRYEKSRDRRTL